ncbi:probable carbohydrate esterase At4g34215 [Zingiber officinale]|uniref:Sialate O-acetylesterase domain-containing protein n=1 Tax=Zingiber officinale TaxID=94328 RepID=A0A8J5F6Z1_ZINOF|nr:probable carbohydrate esterase At4g34215 [Zingiber officinale]KAG6477889.1 hypothetical protein ZIOFF_061321 [Zingiber officinale]
MPSVGSRALALLCFAVLASARRLDPRRPLSGYDRTAPEALIFVLAGQSNMAGNGGVNGGPWDGVVPPQCRPSSSILRLDARLHWEVAREPLHADIDVNMSCGVGPGMPFAHALLTSSLLPRHPPPTIGLVPCAIGGTSIQEWARGTPLYGSLVRRATAAAAAGRLAAVLWYQGESDTVVRADAEAYRGRMKRLIRDLRADLFSPELPLIQVALASGEGNFTEVVRHAQKGIKLPNVACVDGKGLPLEADHVHLTTEAQVKLGKMLAKAYLKLTATAD